MGRKDEDARCYGLVLPGVRNGRAEGICWFDRDQREAAWPQTAEQIDPLEDRVADCKAAGNQKIVFTSHSEDPVRVRAFPVKGLAHGSQITLLEVSPVVHLGHAQADGLAKGAGGDSGPPVQDQRDLDLAMKRSSRSRSRSCVPSNFHMDVADAHGQQVDARGSDKACRELRVGQASFSAMPGKARRQLAELGLDGNPVCMGKLKSSAATRSR